MTRVSCWKDREPQHRLKFLKSKQLELVIALTNIPLYNFFSDLEELGISFFTINSFSNYTNFPASF